MATRYRDRDGNAMPREEVHGLAPEELAERSGIPVKMFPGTGELYEAVADMMIDVIREKQGERVTMIVPVGPLGQYPVFARKVREQGLDCRNLWTFNMDEFLDRNGKTIPTTHPLSFRKSMKECFFDRLPTDLRMPEKQMLFPRHDNMDAVDEALDHYAPDGVDLCLAGVGPEGHVAFNEDPNFGHVEVTEEEFLADRTRLVLVNTSTIDMDALVASCGDRAAIPPFAVTLGPHDLLRAKRTEVVFFAGRFQRFALRETLFRTPTMHFPGSLMKCRKEPNGHLVLRDLTVWTTEEEAGPVTSQTIG